MHEALTTCLQRGEIADTSIRRSTLLVGFLFLPRAERAHPIRVTLLDVGTQEPLAFDLPRSGIPQPFHRALESPAQTCYNQRQITLTRRSSAMHVCWAMPLRLETLSAGSCAPQEARGFLRGTRKAFAIALGLMMQASGCSLDSLMSRAHTASLALKQHGIEVHHGRIVRVIRF